MKVRDIIRQLEGAGWVQTSQSGSHRQFTHPTRKGKVTVNGGRNDDLDLNLIKSIERQSGLRLR